MDYTSFIITAPLLVMGHDEVFFTFLKAGIGNVILIGCLNAE
jgi:hypothetical protein